MTDLHSMAESVREREFAESCLISMARHLTELRPVEPAPCALCAELGRPCLAHREADDWAACFAGIPSPIAPDHAA